jgi:hypothetical protein
MTHTTKPIFNRSVIMPLAKTDISPRVTPPAIPAYEFNDDQLVPYVAVLPPLTAANRPDWQVSRRKRFRKAIAALHPTDRAQWHIALNAGHGSDLVKNLLGRARARWNSPEDTRWLGRQAAKLMRIGDRLERSLRREQKIAVRGGGGRAAASLDLPAKEAPSRNDAVQPEASDLAGVAPASPAAPFGVIPPVQGKATKAPGQRRQRARQTTFGPGSGLGALL